MSKQNVITQEGVITEALGNSMFRVEIQFGDAAHIVIATISGKIRQNNIRLLVGDKVMCEFSPYDMSRARISYRMKS